jgi:hypothetical protein
MRNTVINVLDVLPATIANGQSLSGALNLGGLRLFRIATPTAITGTTLTFQASYDGTTWNNLYDATGTEVSMTVAASRSIVIDPAVFASVNHLKIRSGTSGTPVNQGQDSTLQLVLRAV